MKISFGFTCKQHLFLDHFELLGRLDQVLESFHESRFALRLKRIVHVLLEIFVLHFYSIQVCRVDFVQVLIVQFVVFDYFRIGFHQFDVFVRFVVDLFECLEYTFGKLVHFLANRMMSIFRLELGIGLGHFCAAHSFRSLLDGFQKEYLSICFVCFNWFGFNAEFLFQLSKTIYGIKINC